MKTKPQRVRKPARPIRARSAQKQQTREVVVHGGKLRLMAAIALESIMHPLTKTVITLKKRSG